MPALFMEGEIRDLEHQKASQRETRVLGFDIFHATFTQALLQYSHYEPIYFTAEAASLAEYRGLPPWMAEFRERIRLVSAYDTRTFSRLEDLILLSAGPEMLHYAWIREQMKHPEWPIVAIAHSLSPAPRIRYFFTNNLFMHLGLQDALVCSSRAAHRVLVNMFHAVPEPLRMTGDIPFTMPIIPLGITVDDFSNRDRNAARTALGVPHDSALILYLGRFSHTDKCDLMPLIIAFARLADTPSAQLLIAGDDTQFHVARSFLRVATELGCADRVKVITNPSRSEKVDMFAAADVFASPSDNVQESFGITITEAMAAGLPIVASDWNGYKELVQHGTTGFLVPTYLPPLTDRLEIMSFYSGWQNEKLLAMTSAVDVDLLAKYLGVLVRNPSLRKTMGKAAQEQARRYDWKTIIAEYDRLFDALREQGKQVPRLLADFKCTSFQDIFAHYPTSSDGPDELFAVAEQSLSDQPFLIDVMSTGLRFKKQVFEDILGILNEGGPATLQQLKSRAALDDTDPFSLNLHLGRLLKYGIIVRQPPAVESALDFESSATSLQKV